MIPEAALGPLARRFRPANRVVQRLLSSRSLTGWGKANRGRCENDMKQSPRATKATMKTVRSEVRQQILDLLSEANGESYDDVCRSAIELTQGSLARNWEDDAKRKRPSPSDLTKTQRWVAKYEGVRVVRDLLWDKLATTESDESVWLTPMGWKAAEHEETVKNYA
jgi:hypothetical protein